MTADGLNRNGESLHFQGRQSSIGGVAACLMLALLIWPLSAKAQNAAGSPPPAPPTLFTSDDYPKVALREHQEGTVIAQLLISNKGRVARCEIVQSSGYVALDRATCAVIQERASFLPARDDLGNAVEDSVQTPPITWVHPSDHIKNLPEQIIGSPPFESFLCKSLKHKAKQARQAKVAPSEPIWEVDCDKKVLAFRFAVNASIEPYLTNWRASGLEIGICPFMRTRWGRLVEVGGWKIENALDFADGQKFRAAAPCVSYLLGPQPTDNPHRN